MAMNVFCNILFYEDILLFSSEIYDAKVIILPKTSGEYERMKLHIKIKLL